MARVFITGSADGLGRAAAQTLLNDGHEVVVHARNRNRLTAVRDLLDRGAAAVVGDLSDPERAVSPRREPPGPAGRGDPDAGVYTGPHVLPVNVVAPYLLTALIDRPQRLVYLSNGEHRSGRPSLTGIDWSGRRTTGSYPDSKLFVYAHRCRRPGDGRRCSTARSTLGGCPPRWADPVRPTICGSGTSQEWLATSEDPEARASGGYWHHQRRDRAASRRP